MYVLINRKGQYFAGYDVDDAYEPLTTNDIDDAARFSLADALYKQECLGINWKVTYIK